METQAKKRILVITIIVAAAAVILALAFGIGWENIYAATCPGLVVNEATEGFLSADTGGQDMADATQQTAVPTPQPSEAVPIYEQVQLDPQDTAAHTASWGDNVLDVRMQAPVLLPDAPSMPQVRVTAADFTQEQVDQIAGLLFGDNTVYEEEAQTKAQIQAEMDSITKQIGYMEESGEYSNYYDEMLQRLEELEQALPTAPDGPQNIPWDGKLESVPVRMPDGSEETRTEANIYAEDASGLQSHMRVQNNPGVEENLHFLYEISDGGWAQRSGAQLYFQPDYRLNIEETPEELTSEREQMVGMSVEQAQQQAAAFFEEIGVDMQHAYTRYVDIWPGDESISAADAPSAAFRVHFTRRSQDIAALHDWGMSVVPPSVERGTVHYSVWDYEIAYVTICDSGILEVYWQSPLRETDVLPQIRELMPYEEILQICKENLLKEYGNYYREYAQSGEGYSAEIYIDSVQLGYFREEDEYSITSGTLVPMWGFFGGATLTMDMMDGETFTDKQPDPSPLILINALDGSIVRQEYFATPASL